MKTTILLVVVALAVIYIGLHKLLVLPHDAREPPLVPSLVPFIGHVIGMIRHGSRYYTKLSKRWQYPLYTIGLPRGKAYIVNDPRLISVIDRQAQAISFAPIVLVLAKRIFDPSPEMAEKLAEDILEENPTPCLRRETLDVMNATLTAEKDLEKLTQDFVASVDARLSDLLKGRESRKEDLFLWSRDIVTAGTTDSLYGQAMNPFHDRKVEEGFWSIDEEFALLGLNVLPNIVAQKGYEGRERLFQAFRKFYADNGLAGASEVVRARHQTNTKAGVSIDDIARVELAVVFGGLTNTVPATGWSLYYLFSNAELLHKVEQTVLEAVDIEQARADGYRRVNIALVVRKCPLLTSLIRETLRVHSTNAAARVLMKDIIIEDRYLLKKDAMLFIPSEDIHNNESAWGPTARDFDPERFLPGHKTANKAPASANRTFGTGSAVCPGRYLAINEILAILIIMMLRYDVCPRTKDGRVPRGVPHITKSILAPVEDIPVEFGVRSSTSGVKWEFYWDSAEAQK